MHEQHPEMDLDESQHSVKHGINDGSDGSDNDEQHEGGGNTNIIKNPKQLVKKTGEKTK